jgi:cytoskeletal protein CcmA (bactofilin family)
MAWNRNDDASPNPAPPATARGAKMSTLGPSISIEGDLTGAEDLRIEGAVKGTIRLDKQSVVVSGSGRITADIYSRSICVEGQVKGNLHGEKEIIIRPSGRLEGNIMAPSVTLENGAMFRGSIDMEPKPKARESAAKESAAAPGKRPTGQRSPAHATPATAES